MPQKEITLTYRWFQEVWNQGIENSIDELMDSQATIHGIDGLNEPGASGFKQFYHSFLQNFENVHVDVVKVITEGDFESSLCKVSAKHIDSGQTVHFTGQTTIKIKDGRILEGWNSFDFLSMYEQLGFALAPAKAIMTALN